MKEVLYMLLFIGGVYCMQRGIGEQVNGTSRYWLGWIMAGIVLAVILAQLATGHFWK